MFGLSLILAEMPDCLKLDSLASRRRWLHVGKRSCIFSCNAAWVLGYSPLTGRGLQRWATAALSEEVSHGVTEFMAVGWRTWLYFIFKKIFWREKRNSILPILLRVSCYRSFKNKVNFSKIANPTKIFKNRICWCPPPPPTSKSCLEQSPPFEILE